MRGPALRNIDDMENVLGDDYVKNIGSMSRGLHGEDICVVSDESVEWSAAVQGRVFGILFVGKEAGDR